MAVLRDMVQPSWRSIYLPNSPLPAPFLLAGQIHHSRCSPQIVEMSLDQGQDLGMTLKPRNLLRGEITHSVAKEEDANILHELGYRDEKIRFFTHLHRNRKLIQSMAAHQLSITEIDACHLVDVEDGCLL